MACAGAVRAVRQVLCLDEAQTAIEIFELINWWTLPTIEEALTELVSRRQAVWVLENGERHFVRESSHASV